MWGRRETGRRGDRQREGGEGREGERRTRELAAYAGFDTGHLEAVDLVPELQSAQFKILLESGRFKRTLENGSYMQSHCVRGLEPLLLRIGASRPLEWR